MSINENLSDQQLNQDIEINQNRIIISMNLQEYLSKIFKQEIKVYVNGISECVGLTAEQVFKSDIWDIYIGAEYIENLSFYANIVEFMDSEINKNSDERKTNIHLYLFNDLDDIKYEITLCAKGYSQESKEYGVCGFPFVPYENVSYEEKITNCD